MKRPPGSLNELLDAIRVLEPLDLHPAAYIDSKWTHLPNRGTNVLGIESAPEQDWHGGTNLVGEPPVGTGSGSARASLRIAINQDPDRGT